MTNHATAKTATYHYDPSGERSEKLVTGAWGVVHEARYSVDATFEVDTVNDTHEVHVFVGSRRVATSKRTGLGAGTASDSVSQVTFYHPDQVGTNSVTTITTPSSQSVSRAYLDPFGEKQAGTGGDARHLFTDQERDAETGLDYFGARYYDAWVGRFLEQDPELVGRGTAVLDAIPSDTHYANPYAYALNRPTAIIDPTGRIPFWALGASAAFEPSDGGGSEQGAAGSGSSGGNSIALQAAGSSSSDSRGAEPDPEIETITVEGERQGSEEGIPTYESGSGTLPGGTPWYSYTPIGDVGGEGIDWVDTALDVVTYGLIGMDLLLGGPTGEGIVPAMAIGTFRLGGRQAAKQAAEEAFRKEAGDLPKRVLRETREGLEENQGRWCRQGELSTQAGW